MATLWGGPFWGKIHPPHGASHPKNTRFRSICLPNVPGRMYTPNIKRIRSHFLTVEMPNFMSRMLVFSFMFFLLSFRFAVYSYWWWLTVISETKPKTLKNKFCIKKSFFLFLRKLSKTNSKLKIGNFLGRANFGVKFTLSHPMGPPTPKTLGFVPYAYRIYTPKIKRIGSHFLTVEMPNFINRISVLSFLFFSCFVSFRCLQLLVVDNCN